MTDYRTFETAAHQMKWPRLKWLLTEHPLFCDSLELRERFHLLLYTYGYLANTAIFPLPEMRFYHIFHIT